APRADPDGPNSGIRFLPRVFDVKAHIWPGMEVARLRKPVARQSLHPLPRETILLAPTPKRAMPDPYHVAAESGYARAVRGNRVSRPPRYPSFAARWLAYALPYRRFACTFTGTCARLGADAVRYSFIVADFHHLLLAGFTGAPHARVFDHA